MSASFDREAFMALNCAARLGRRLECHESTPSTMSLADELLGREGPSCHGTVILAETQTAGQGRRGRSWLSAPAGNLYFSMVWAPAAASEGAAAMLPELVRLNLAAGVAVASAADAAGVPGARIKWPNDVWAGEPAKKLSGMIINFNGKDAAVLGVGVNVLEELGGSAFATSLATLRASAPAPAPPPSREAVLAAFCVELERLMSLSTEGVLAEYRQRDLLAGRTIRVHHRSREEDDPRDFDAEAIGVDAQGMLRVRPAGGGPEASLSGEEVSITPRLQ